MKLILTDDEGTVIDQWVISRNEPLSYCDPEPFEALCKVVPKYTVDKIKSELIDYNMRVLAEEDN